MRIQLQEWFMENKPDEKLIYKDGLSRQVLFIRDIIPGIFARSYEEYTGIKNSIFVISTHTSKSVKLPVYELSWNDCRFIMRYNFYDWKVTARLPYKFKEIEIEFMKLFDPKAEVHKVYCEGFRDDWVKPPYGKNTREFTCELHNNYVIHTFFHIIKHSVLKEE